MLRAEKTYYVIIAAERTAMITASLRSFTLCGLCVSVVTTFLIPHRHNNINFLTALDFSYCLIFSLLYQHLKADSPCPVIQGILLGPRIHNIQFIDFQILLSNVQRPGQTRRIRVLDLISYSFASIKNKQIQLGPPRGWTRNSSLLARPDENEGGTQWQIPPRRAQAWDET